MTKKVSTRNADEILREYINQEELDRLVRSLWLLKTSNGGHGEIVLEIKNSRVFEIKLQFGLRDTRQNQ